MALLVPATLLGMGIGLLGDVLSGDGLITVDGVLGSLMIFPLSILGLAGLSGVPNMLMPFFMVGSCLFCPVYAGLALLWVLKSRRWALLALVPWCAQAGFQVVHRFEALMSV